MPKLNEATAAAADQQASEGRAPLPEGWYTCTLDSVEAREARSGGGMNWNWAFTVALGEHKGRKIFVTTSLKQTALFKISEIMSAFGVATDTDTDDLVNQALRIQIKHRTIQQGERAGEIGIDAKKFSPATEDDLEAIASGEDGSDGEYDPDDEDEIPL
jgi:hypothetical protein